MIISAENDWIILSININIITIIIIIIIIINIAVIVVVINYSCLSVMPVSDACIHE